jgi:hypothetical protein
MREEAPRTLAEARLRPLRGPWRRSRVSWPSRKNGPRSAQPRPRKGAPREAPSATVSDMNPGDPRPLLDRHAARVLTRWRERLRALPPSSALAHPDLLGPLMAPALARVRQEATQPSADTLKGADEAPMSCRCGLNPLVAFYLTGECATFDVLWGQADALPHLAPGERENLCRTLSLAWRRVATDEISLFCSLCQRRNVLEAQDKERSAAVLSRAAAREGVARPCRV